MGVKELAIEYFGKTAFQAKGTESTKGLKQEGLLICSRNKKTSVVE